MCHTVLSSFKGNNPPILSYHPRLIIRVFLYFIASVFFLSLTQGPRQSADGVIRTSVSSHTWSSWFGLGVRSCVRRFSMEPGFWATSWDQYLFFPSLLLGVASVPCLAFPSAWSPGSMRKGVPHLLDLRHLTLSLR